MKTLCTVLLTTCICYHCFGQDSKKDAIPFNDSTVTLMMKKAADNACLCIDTLHSYNKLRSKVSAEINDCIKNQMALYMVSSSFLGIGDAIKEAIQGAEKAPDGKKTVTMNKGPLVIDPNSDTYKKDYYEIERYLMKNCTSLINLVSLNDATSTSSLSRNPRAIEFYNKGDDEQRTKNYRKAVGYYEEAVKSDSNFAFAWDNVGICYRKLGEYDKALYAYNKSLEIDPIGQVPLLNIAIVYEHIKQYDKAIDAYKKIALTNPNDPEVYYGVGRIYFIYLNDNEKALDNMCKAYNLYIAQHSPYRTDAETQINDIMRKMKEAGHFDKFKEILHANNIRTE